MISSTITKTLEHDGVTIVRNAEVKHVSSHSPYDSRPQPYRSPLGENNITLHVSVDGGDSSDFSGFDEVVYAIGRSPAVEDLGLEHLPGVRVDAATNHIQNDEFSNTGARVSLRNVLLPRAALCFNFLSTVLSPELFSSRLLLSLLLYFIRLSCLTLNQ